MGKGQVKLIVGLRDPFDLAFSRWCFLPQNGAEGKRVELRMGRALAAIQECNQTLAADPTLLLQLSSNQLTAYRLCLDDRKRARQHFWVYGGLYALHLLGCLQLGFRSRQFLFVKMTSCALPWRRTLIAATAADERPARCMRRVDSTSYASPPAPTGWPTESGERAIAPTITPATPPGRLPRDIESALQLQNELSSFLDLPLSDEVTRRHAGRGGVCLGQSMVTSKKSRIRVHNATVKEVKRSVTRPHAKKPRAHDDSDPSAVRYAMPKAPCYLEPCS